MPIKTETMARHHVECARDIFFSVWRGRLLDDYTAATPSCAHATTSEQVENSRATVLRIPSRKCRRVRHLQRTRWICPRSAWVDSLVRTRVSSSRKSTASPCGSMLPRKQDTPRCVNVPPLYVKKKSSKYVRITSTEPEGERAAPVTSLPVTQDGSMGSVATKVAVTVSPRFAVSRYNHPRFRPNGHY